jgi:class 3 adenylate cyclase
VINRITTTMIIDNLYLCSNYILIKRVDKLVSYSTPTVDVNDIMRSVADTQNTLAKAARSKMNFVILNVDLVASTKLSMTLPLDRLTMMIQAFNQEMSLIVKNLVDLF